VCSPATALPAKIRKMNLTSDNATNDGVIFRSGTARIPRRHILAFALLALVAASYFAWTWQADIGQLGSDGPNYLMMANHYAHGNLADPVYSDNAAYSRFPPLYPLLLAWCHAADNFWRIHLVTTSCLILALAVFYAWLILEGMSSAQSALLVLLFAALPGTWLAGLLVQSEYLYLLWSLLAILLLTVYRRNGAVNALYGAALAIALATLTRTIGIALFAPFALVLLRAPRRGAVLALIVSLLPLLIWYLLHRSRVGYTDALGLIYSGDGLSTLRAQLAKELPALRTGFGTNFLHHAHLQAIADALGMLCMAGTAWRAIKFKPDAVYIVANLLILMVWPYPEEAQRFLWVLVPLLLAQPILVVTDHKYAMVPSQASQWLTGIISITVLLMTLPALALASDRYRSAAYTDLPKARIFVSWYGEDAAHAQDVVEIQTAMINSMRRVAKEVPESDCVIGTRPDLVSYFGRRRSYFPPLNSVPDPYFGRQIRATGCHFAFGMYSIDSRYPVPLFPIGRFGKNIDVVFYNTIPDAKGNQGKLTSMLARFD
jgi:hypothetical protein